MRKYPDKNGWGCSARREAQHLFLEALNTYLQARQTLHPPTPEQRAALEAERAIAAKAATELEAQQQAAAKAKAATLWAKARDVDAKHPYLIAKGIRPMGIKQLGKNADGAD